jgi:hypothetical protein
MTDNIEETETVEESTETVLEAPPFLKITSMWPSGGDRVETFTLELNVGAEEPIAEYDDGEGAAARSWLIDLVTATIRELRGGGTPPSVAISGPAMQTTLAGYAKHAEGCDGFCGLPPCVGMTPVDTLRLVRGDREPGDDRKDDL